MVGEVSEVEGTEVIIRTFFTGHLYYGDTKFKGKMMFLNPFISLWTLPRDYWDYISPKGFHWVHKLVCTSLQYKKIRFGTDDTSLSIGMSVVFSTLFVVQRISVSFGGVGSSP